MGRIRIFLSPISVELIMPIVLIDQSQGNQRLADAWDDSGCGWKYKYLQRKMEQLLSFIVKFCK